MATKNLTQQLLELLQKTKHLGPIEAAEKLGVKPASLRIPVNTLTSLGRITVTEDLDGTLNFVEDPPSDADLVRAAIAANRGYQVRPLRAGGLAHEMKLKVEDIQAALDELVAAGELVEDHSDPDQDDDGFYDRRPRYLTPAAQAMQDEEATEARRHEDERRQAVEREARRGALANQILTIFWPDGVAVDQLDKAGTVRTDLLRLINKHDL